MPKNKVVLTLEEMSYETTITNLISKESQEAGVKIKAILELVKDPIHQEYLCKKLTVSVLL